jgi:hypothetical protein
LGVVVVVGGSVVGAAVSAGVVSGVVCVGAVAAGGRLRCTPVDDVASVVTAGVARVVDAHAVAAINRRPLNTVATMGLRRQPWGRREVAIASTLDALQVR